MINNCVILQNRRHVSSNFVFVFLPDLYFLTEEALEFFSKYDNRCQCYFIVNTPKQNYTY